MRDRLNSLSINKKLKDSDYKMYAYNFNLVYQFVEQHIAKSENAELISNARAMLLEDLAFLSILSSTGGEYELAQKLID